MESQKNAYEHYLSLPDDSQEQESYYDTCAEMMDDELREILHPCHCGDLNTDDKFLKAYCEHHLKIFGTEFIVK